ncbi:MAG TPA: hypothetical protein VII56_21460 [Rhizomicrobium sp.]
MSEASVTGPIGIGIRDSLSRAGWIQSPAFDFFFLICAPLVTVPIMAGVFLRIPILAIVAATALAFVHYISTGAFYFWSENQAYYRSRWLAFYGGPVILAALYFLLVGLHVPYVLQLVLFFWNTWHVSRQNCGILAIYRSRAGVSDPQQKSTANNAILAVSLFLCIWNIRTHQQVGPLFAMIATDFARYLKYATGAVAAFFVLKFFVALARRQEPLGIPEGLFIVSSLVFFYPYLLLRDSQYATLIMLLPHYVQYLALVWLLHRRKFAGPSAGIPAPLRFLSTKLVVLLPALVLVGYGFAKLQDFSMQHGYTDVFFTFYLLLALEHFYLDGLIWSFRRPHVRQTILPFLLRRGAGATP